MKTERPQIRKLIKQYFEKFPTISSGEIYIIQLLTEDKDEPAWTFNGDFRFEHRQAVLKVDIGRKMPTFDTYAEARTALYNFLQECLAL